MSYELKRTSIIILSPEQYEYYLTCVGLSEEEAKRIVDKQYKKQHGTDRKQYKFDDTDKIS